MKLIDLLVQELPKRGGWPDGAERASVGDFNGNSITVVFCFPSGYSNGFDVPFQYTMTFSIPDCCVNVATDYCMITRDLYESALSASQKPAWNGEGVPPVGCECECQFLDAWHLCKVLFVGAEVIVGVIDGSERAFSVSHTKFRPLRTESERKHEAVLESICAILEMVAQDYKREDEAKLIYEAIAAGKIPGVKLDD
ncbi:hypothetical protein CHY78_14585 [Salmonella enterica]|nr:hypothetical protein [Salmonella enterica]